MKQRFAWQFFKADFNSGQLSLLLSALFLSVFLVTGMGMLIERLQLMLVGESSQFLAADRVLSSPREVDDAWLAKADSLGLQQARFIAFQSMLYFDDEPLLVSAKAASSAYSLKGELKYRKSYYGQVFETSDGPKVGEIWLAARALQSLGVNIGDSVYLGDGEFTVSAELVSEPDRGMAAFSLGPRVLMHLDDVPKTHVVQLGSRINYRYLFQGSAEQLDELAEFIAPNLEDSHKWLDLENSQPRVADSLNRATLFFFLASSFVVILSSIALSLASLRYAKQHVQHVAVLKTLGASAWQIERLFLQLLSIIFVIVVAVALLLAFIAQWGVISYIAASKQLPQPEMVYSPLLLGAAVSALCLLSFTLPQFHRLNRISAMAVFRSKSAAVLQLDKSAIAMALTGLWLVLWLYSQNLLLACALIAMLALLSALLYLPLLRLLPRFVLALAAFLKQVANTSGRATTARLALSNIAKNAEASARQVAVMTVSLTLLIVLLALQDDLFQQWRDQLPEKTPNYFLLNIQPAELDEVSLWLDDNEFATEKLYPMVRGRLIMINQTPVRELVSKEDFSRSGADRELNLSWSESLPSSNEIIAGEWFAASSTASGVSVESKLAEKLNIQLGDELGFQITAQRFHVKVVSIREVDWNSMQPNFYMLLPQSSLQPFAKTYMTSFYLPETRSTEIVALLKRFPTAVLIDVNALINQVRSVVAQVSEALNWVLALVFAGGILVLLASVQSSFDQRIKEAAIIRALGASTGQIYQIVLLEFLVLALCSGFSASVISELILQLLQWQVFDLPFKIHPHYWVLAPVMAVFLWLLAAFFSVKQVVSTKPVKLLKA